MNVKKPTNMIVSGTALNKNVGESYVKVTIYKAIEYLCC